MKLNRTKNAVRNTVFGGLNFVYSTITPFAMRTLMLYFLGVEYTGLNGLFASILQVLNLTELGVGSAMDYSMYKAIADDDEARICALMKLYRKYYRIIGCVIGAIGLAIFPFIPNLIKGGVPEDLNVYILYLLNLSTTVCSYFLFAYKNVLLSSFQRSDVASKVTIGVNTVTYISQALVLVIFRNYYIFLILSLLSQLMVNVCTAFFTNRLFPNYHPEGELSRENIEIINKRVRDVFTSKIAMVVTNSSDPIVISSFLGLSILAMYQNYYYIVNALTSVLSVFLGAVMAGFGNSLLTETPEKNERDLRKFTMMIMWISVTFTSCLLSVFEPFMDVWVGRDLQFEFGIVICFCALYYTGAISRLLNMYKDAAGIWNYDKFRPLTAAMTNLALNLLTVHRFGVYGVILSTVVARVVVEVPWILRNLFKYVFKGDAFIPYTKRVIFYTFDTVLICFVTWFVARYINFARPIYTFFARGIVCALIANILLFITLRNLSEYQDCKAFFITMLNKTKLVIGKGR